MTRDSTYGERTGGINETMSKIITIPEKNQPLFLEEIHHPTPKRGHMSLGMGNFSRYMSLARDVPFALFSYAEAFENLIENVG
jgi:hypothetical protein